MGLEWLEEMASNSPGEAAARATIVLIEEIRELREKIGTMADDIFELKLLVGAIDIPTDAAPEMGACTDRLVERIDEIGEKIEKGFETVVEKLDEDS